jgi:hypothetical protein
MDLQLFDEVADLVQSMAPSELGTVRTRSHRRGIKLWLDTDKPGREHYEAQLLSRRHVDGTDGMALEVGFHSEYPDVKKNEAVASVLADGEQSWRKQLGEPAELGAVYGADNWRRLSECWNEPDLDEPDLAFELAARLVDYVLAVEPLLEERAAKR